VTLNLISSRRREEEEEILSHTYAHSLSLTHTHTNTRMARETLEMLAGHGDIQWSMIHRRRLIHHVRSNHQVFLV
jgi:hypothetical protein